ncbi:hypothetical protein BGZ76_001008 [Entomortierella beljakovae]|nr:hypothetical protein BGZ76_001008 [Entomortierella beljakovae]
MPQGKYSDGNDGSDYEDHQNKTSIDNPQLGRTNAITYDHDLEQSSSNPTSIPHRQINHAEQTTIISKNHKNQGKIKKFKGNRINPVISIDGPSGDSQEYVDDGQSNQRVSRDRVYDLEKSTSNEDEEHLATGQMKMYRTRSYNSNLSFERGNDAAEKQNNFDGDDNGYSSPIFRVDPEMEQTVLRKLDRNLLPLLGILYLFSYLDRVNIGNARLFGLEDDIKMTNGQYNIALASFFLAYCIFEIPSNMVLVRLGPRMWIPIIMVIWGSISLGLAWVTSFKGLVIARFALGAAEAGFVPGALFYLTLFYKRSEHSFRIALFLCFNILAGAFGGLLAAGISHLSGKFGLQGWQWIFITEAIPTILLALLTWIVMSPSPDKAHFLSPEERIYATNRILADTDIRPTPQASWNQTKAALTDPRRVWGSKL